MIHASVRESTSMWMYRDARSLWESWGDGPHYRLWSMEAARTTNCKCWVHRPELSGPWLRVVPWSPGQHPSVQTFISTWPCLAHLHVRWLTSWNRKTYRAYNNKAVVAAQQALYSETEARKSSTGGEGRLIPLSNKPFMLALYAERSG